MQSGLIRWIMRAWCMFALCISANPLESGFQSTCICHFRLSQGFRSWIPMTVCLPENHCWGLNEICVRIRFKKDLSVAALLLKGDGQLFVMLFHAAECVLSISLILFSTVQNFAQEMNKYKYSLRYPLPSHVPLAYPVTQQSQDGCWVSVDLKRGGRMPRKRCYFVNLVVPERHRG